ncbi:polysaccharide biosynthesis C-terminal domain-containing protein [Gemmata sp. JC717]|uniref:lipopolysaccharide biosynthesis protein n=1 Tax=Gemmata algarum TaxID=2975278 RepID=UPI0021BACCFA|nr:polysaccharide biosynthesis C-terminal domain-containing protein [Gemmata algarum]MDY3556089.1 polysaccharide biosynthesis C-terminal domain-containing protein [Gemmata algarum]
MSESRSAKRSLLIGAATNWAAFVATLAVGFFLAPYMVKSLGVARYGVWCVVESVLAYFTLFDMGIAACLVRFVAKYHATESRHELNKLVSACLALFVLAGAGVLLVGGAVVPFVAPGLERKLGESGDVLSFTLLVLANLAVTLPLSAFPAILDGLQRFGVKSLVRLVCLALRVGGIVWAMETRPGLLPLAVVLTVTNVLEHALMALCCFRFLPGLRVSIRLIDRATVKDVRGYSLDAFLAMVAGRITVQTGAIVTGGFLTFAAAAHYAIALRLVDMAKNLLRSATTTLTPAVSQREASGDMTGVRRVLLDGTRAVLYLVLPIHLGLLFFGAPFLVRWMGEEQYAEWCFPATAVLSATLTIGVAQSVASRILYGMGKLKLFARLALVEAGVNLALSLALVKPFGIVGVAVAVAVPNVLFCLFVIGYACRTLDVGVWHYLRESWTKPLVAVSVPALVWWGVTPVEAKWLSIAIGVATGLAPFAAVVAAIELAPRRQALWARFSRPRPTPESGPRVAEA